MATHNKKRYVISVLVSDRVGVLRDITSAVTATGANIDGISQTVVEGYFTVILTATFDKPVSPEAVRHAILENFRHDEASVVVRSYERKNPTRRTVDGEQYVTTVTGRDRKGILKTVTTFLASKGINVEDWYVDFHGDDVTHIGEITVPHALDIKQVQEEFRQVVAPLKLTACFQHANIFRATNEVGPIKSLLGGPSDA
jgi:glycine cleavage system transcriptional repressor